jgi:citrate synthase
MTKEDSALIRGLEGVVAAETRLCDLDGAHGRLAYVGYDIDELARLASFEEVAYLLWHGELPRPAQLDALTVQLTAAREIPRDVVRAFGLMPKDTDPMRALQAAVALLGMHDPDATDNTHAANVRKAVRLTAQLATAICAHHRIRSGQEPVPPAAGLGHAANFLYMLEGKEADTEAVEAMDMDFLILAEHGANASASAAVKAFDASLTLYAEHELNASTFTTRTIVSTQSDMHSAVAGGVGALKGPLHGGAGEAVMRTLLEIGEVANVDAFTQKALAEKRRLMGFGHRVYKAGDPRAAILRGMAEEACRQSGQFKWYEMAVKLHERIGGAKGLIPNVDFYSAPLFYSLGIPVDLFTPVIAAGRIAGWTANIIEQHDDNRLIRPRADYVGPARRAFVAIGRR